MRTPKRHPGRRFRIVPGWISSRGGFTLVEMMIALVVFGLGLMALAQSLPRGLSMRDKARRMSVATNLAQQEMERLRSLPFDSPQLAGGSHSDPQGPVEGVYARRWSVLENSPVEDMKTVTVTVSFPTSSADSVAQMTTHLSK